MTFVCWPMQCLSVVNKDEMRICHKTATSYFINVLQSFQKKSAAISIRNEKFISIKKTEETLNIFPFYKFFSLSFGN